MMSTKPGQHVKQQPDISADIYSLAIIMHEVVNREGAFYVKNMAFDAAGRPTPLQLCPISN